MKALYNCIKSGILWCNLFSETLRKLVFVFNPHDLCVAKKVINGKQFTITWYVSKLKVPHVESSVTDEVVRAIKSYFEKMIVTRGVHHKYVGIEIELTGGGKVVLLQKGSFLECLDAFGEYFVTPVDFPSIEGAV